MVPANKSWTIRALIYAAQFLYAVAVAALMLLAAGSAAWVVLLFLSTGRL